VGAIREEQLSFFKMQQDELKTWRRARSDMQLYFSELKKRDTLKEEYSAVADAVEMFVDLHRVGLQSENRDKWTKKELEINQVKYNILDLIKQRVMDVRQKISLSLLHGNVKDNTLNFALYEQHRSAIDPTKERHALVDLIQEKYVKQVLNRMDNEQLVQLHRQAEKF